MAKQWLRLYTEIRHDRKLRRLSPARRWLWITLLSIAKESPCPGWLLYSEGVPVNFDDLADEAAVDREEVEAGLKDFTEQRMVEKVDGVWRLLNWDKRQFTSDSARERVKKHREKKKSAQSPTAPAEVKEPAGCGDDCNNVVTLQGCYKEGPCNVAVMSPETKTETETAAKGLSSCISNAPLRVPLEYPFGTPTVLERVPAKYPPGKPSGTSASTGTGTPTSTETVPVPVPVRRPEPHSGAASQSPKNIKNKELKNRDLYNKNHNKDLKNVVATADLTEHFIRAFGRELKPYEVSYITNQRSNFQEELILAALSIAILQDKRSMAGVGSILTNWQLQGVRTVAEIPPKKMG